MRPTKDFLQAVSDLGSLLEQSPISDQVVMVHEHFDTSPTRAVIKVILSKPLPEVLHIVAEFRGYKVLVEVKDQNTNLKIQTSTYSTNPNATEKVDEFSGLDLVGIYYKNK